VLGRLILLIAVAIAVITLLQLLKKTPQSQRKNLYWKIGFSLLGIALVLLAVTGRIHWVGAMIGALIPFLRQMAPVLIRYFPFLQQYFRKQTQPPPSASNCSQVQTRFLSMTLNHDNNQLSGEVTSGPLAGQSLDSLQLDQLESLLDYCQPDKDSVQLLLNYLSHRFGSDWQQQQSTAGNTSDLSEQAALDVLGLQAGANKQDIIQAHRRLMQKVHPDRGGSDYLAAQINAAKDLLISKLA
jgi:hypothetical protein